MSRTIRVMPNRCSSLSCALVLSCLAGCKTNAPVDHNQIPEANAGPDQVLPYAGAPVTVMLDGGQSSDRDGKLTRFIWISGDDLDGGLGGPDPDDIVFPSVVLGEGVWTFHLFVQDDDGSISAPDTVVITVGEANLPSCDLSACMPASFATACCTSDDTGASAGDGLGRGPGLCGADLGSVLPDLAGMCLQLDQPGSENAACPELPNAAGQMEPGCCTDEGMCGSLNTSVPLGCHYSFDGPGDACTP